MRVVRLIRKDTKQEHVCPLAAGEALQCAISEVPDGVLIEVRTEEMKERAYHSIPATNQRWGQGQAKFGG